MSIDYGFDTNDVEIESNDVAAGKYKVLIDKEEIKDTKDGLNKLLLLTFQVLEGEFKGKLIFNRYNIFHSSEKTKNIAMQQIKRIAEATGKPVNRDYPLVGRVLDITYRKQKDSDYMEISKYEKSDAPF